MARLRFDHRTESSRTSFTILVLWWKDWNVSNEDHNGCSLVVSNIGFYWTFGSDLWCRTFCIIVFTFGSHKMQDVRLVFIECHQKTYTIEKAKWKLVSARCRYQDSYGLWACALQNIHYGFVRKQSLKHKIFLRYSSFFILFSSMFTSIFKLCHVWNSFRFHSSRFWYILHHKWFEKLLNMPHMKKSTI